MAGYQKKICLLGEVSTQEQITIIDRGNLYYRGFGGYLLLLSQNWRHISPTKKLKALYRLNSGIYLEAQEITELERFGLVELDEVNLYRLTLRGSKTLEEAKKFIKNSILKGYAIHDVPNNILA